MIVVFLQTIGTDVVGLAMVRKRIDVASLAGGLISGILLRFPDVRSDLLDVAQNLCGMLPLRVAANRHGLRDDAGKVGEPLGDSSELGLRDIRLYERRVGRSRLPILFEGFL